MNQIHLFAEEASLEQARQYLETHGFEKHVAISPLSDKAVLNSPFRLLVENGKIQVLPDWFNQSLPVLFPGGIQFTQEHLLSLVMYGSGLTEDALTMSAGTKLEPYIRLFSGVTQKVDIKREVKKHNYWHNKAVLAYYVEQSSATIVTAYFEEALKTETSLENKIYSALHYAVFLQDMDNQEEALSIIQEFLKVETLPEACRKALELEQIRCTGHHEVWDKNELIAHKARVWDVYTFYRDQHVTMLEAQLCREMAEVARYEQNFSESLSYISKCIHIYLAEQMPEMEAEANLFKGTLLHQWAKTGSPQFYQQAIKCYQKALHVFNKEEVPHLFAEVHHQLGVLYAEMPDDQKKRAIWAAISATSFKEALNFFNKANSPLEYATVCHNYATALMQYPDAVRSDNVAKAINLFEEALLIRTEEMPEERCVTLLNYLEACWEAENINEHMEQARIKDMQNKALEAFGLAPDEELRNRATEHLNSINKVLETVTI